MRSYDASQPAPDVKSAQKSLVEASLKFGIDVCGIDPSRALRVVEAGSGWGGARSLVHELLPNAHYLGLNCSQAQIDFSVELNTAFKQTRYENCFLENVAQMGLAPQDFVFGIESILHVKDKPSFIKSLHKLGTESIVVAEICSERKDLVMQNPLFYPSLAETMSVSAYEEAFTAAGAKQIFIHDISERVFQPWSDALQVIDERGFGANKRVLRQFKKSYSDLAALSRDDAVKYVWIAASF